jgi:glycosyltransferase involved in cell wall biosynthesis
VKEVALVFPGELTTRTGGYIYDRRAFGALAARGWRVGEVSLATSFPFPDEAALRGADAALAGIPDGTRTVVDGLAFGAMPELAALHHQRLELVALVHHPLCLETGLASEAAVRLRASERAALETARRVIVTSRLTAETLAAEFYVPRARITVAPPGIDPAPVARGSGEPPRLLNVGTVTPRKGHALLIEALAGLRALPWDLVIVGNLDRDAGTANAVRELIGRHGLADRVTLTGELEGEALAAAFNRADIFVSASFYEGYGMAIAEALARGLPVVATSGGATAETVPADAGLLVPPGDAAGLARALHRMLAEPGLRGQLRQGAMRARARLPGWGDTAAIIETALLA